MQVLKKEPWLVTQYWRSLVPAEGLHCHDYFWKLYTATGETSVHSYKPWLEVIKNGILPGIRPRSLEPDAATDLYSSQPTFLLPTNISLIFIGVFICPVWSKYLEEKYALKHSYDVGFRHYVYSAYFTYDCKTWIKRG